VINGGTPSIAEPASIRGLEVRSEDVWERRDNGLFHYRRFTPNTADNTYEAFICAPGSHVEDWAKGCLMARASLKADAAYFGVFRIAENHALRVQYRPGPGRDTEESQKSVKNGRGVSAQALIFVKLQLSDRGRTVRAWGSVTGHASDWVQIDWQTFDEPLIYQGFCASSHELADPVRFLFGTPGGNSPPFRSNYIIGDGRARGRYLPGGFGPV
jgi:hypothetical protein